MINLPPYLKPKSVVALKCLIWRPPRRLQNVSKELIKWEKLVKNSISGKQKLIRRSLMTSELQPRSRPLTTGELKTSCGPQMPLKAPNMSNIWTVNGIRSTTKMLIRNGISSITFETKTWTFTVLNRRLKWRSYGIAVRGASKLLIKMLETSYWGSLTSNQCWIRKIASQMPWCLVLIQSEERIAITSLVRHQ